MHTSLPRTDIFALPEPIGRDSQLTWFRHALERSRFLMITGPEGVGKTHFVRWAAQQCIEGPVLWLGITPETGLETIMAEHLAAASSAFSHLAERIGQQHLVIVVDDLHVSPSLHDTVTLLRQLLQVCPHLRVVAVCRACPDLYGMAHLPIPLLSVPAFDETSLTDIRNREAVQLWTRLYHEKHGTHPNASQLRRGASMVRAVDGLPLGIVASVRHPATLPDLMRGCADRAYAALSDGDALALAVLGQFQRRWPIELGISLLQPWMNAQDAERCVERLVNASAIQRYAAAGQPVTFRVMHSIRDHGRALLRRENQTNRAEHAYTRTLCEFAREACLQSGSDYRRFQRLMVMHFADLQAAWQLLIDRGDLEMAMEITADVWPYWNVSGNMLRYQSVVEHTLRACDTASPARVRCLHASGVLYHLQGEWITSQQRHRQAIAMADALEDPGLQGLAWFGLGQCGLHCGDHELAEQALFTAEEYFTAASEVRGLANVQTMLAIFYWNQQHLERAASIAEAALRWQQSVDEELGLVTSHALVGRIRLDMADEPRGAFHLLRALDLAERIQDQTVMAESLEGLAKLAANQKQHAVAVRLLGAANRRRSSVEHPGWPSTFVPLKRTLQELSSELGDRFEAEFAKGRRLSWANVLEQISQIPVPVSAEVPQLGLTESGRRLLMQLGLTRREREVLVLLAMGAGDRDIAEAFRISVRTVHSHVHRVILKLRVTSRAAAVASAWRLGVLE